jgi:TPR repeat protein
MRISDKAISFYERTCGGGPWDACYETCLIYEKGDAPVKAGPAAAKAFFDRACQHGVDQACAKIGKKPC